ncbi:hypothetical protein HDF16_000385 [Granulicella aggregans]|uniref:Uncharacterized protein n=1 Tax=Granulicella aggregans TaxID=474949 RepID=A0A7W7Z9A5_9BACT|nr:hypothetical protein [Granulicella aggregans]
MIQVVRDADVGTFLQQLRELTEAASANEGPICFE